MLERLLRSKSLGWRNLENRHRSKLFKWEQHILGFFFLTIANIKSNKLLMLTTKLTGARSHSLTHTTIAMPSETISHLRYRRAWIIRISKLAQTLQNMDKYNAYTTYYDPKHVRPWYEDKVMARNEGKGQRTNLRKRRSNRFHVRQQKKQACFVFFFRSIF